MSMVRIYGSEIETKKLKKNAQNRRAIHEICKGDLGKGIFDFEPAAFCSCWGVNTRTICS